MNRHLHACHQKAAPSTSAHKTSAHGKLPLPSLEFVRCSQNKNFKALREKLDGKTLYYDLMSSLGESVIFRGEEGSSRFAFAGALVKINTVFALFSHCFRTLFY